MDKSKRLEALEAVARSRVANKEALDCMRSAAVVLASGTPGEYEDEFDAADAVVALLALIDYATRGIANALSSAR